MSTVLSRIKRYEVSSIIVMASIAADQHAARAKAELKALAESMKRGLGQRVRWQMHEWLMQTGRK